MKKTIGLLVTGLSLTLGMPAQAQFAKAEDAIKYRQASFTLMASHFGRLGSMANGRVPYDAKVAAEHAEIVAYMVKLPWAAFVEGSDKGETKAKPEVWKEAANFKEASEKMQAAVAKLDAAAKLGSIDALKAAFGPAAASCKACHDSFKNK